MENIEINENNVILSLMNLIECDKNMAIKIMNNIIEEREMIIRIMYNFKVNPSYNKNIKDIKVLEAYFNSIDTHDIEEEDFTVNDLNDLVDNLINNWSKLSIDEANERFYKFVNSFDVSFYNTVRLCLAYHFRNDEYNKNYKLNKYDIKEVIEKCYILDHDNVKDILNTEITNRIYNYNYGCSGNEIRNTSELLKRYSISLLKKAYDTIT